ncbi:hypothetical protein TeGR_g2359 [Tetraparma gracilis]|uniref:RNI-like protein n=1 Tax=Tetraparma gracilis TaxID=2962635 RepID=A0ABQ6MK79_9STRA|nr:hypothetical protein TeGR_g2359 [Tetraparma gracilis]
MPAPATRDLPTLQTLCLRSLVASPPNDPFDLLHSPRGGAPRSTPTALLLSALSCRPTQLYKAGYAGQDLQSPWVATSERRTGPVADLSIQGRAKAKQGSGAKEWLGRTIVGGNRVTDLLQSFIDSQVESGSLHDKRLTQQFFALYGDALRNEIGKHPTLPGAPEPPGSPSRSSSNQPAPKKQRRAASPTPPSLKPDPLPDNKDACLSLHQCALLGPETFASFAAAAPRLGATLTILDLSGCYNLTSPLLADLVLPSIPAITRLSLKNCRKLTDACVPPIGRLLPSLSALDLGGCFNISPQAVIDLVSSPTLATSALSSLHVSGLGWCDDTLPLLLAPYSSRPPARCHLSSLSIGYSVKVTAPCLARVLPAVLPTLNELSLPFSPAAVTLDTLAMVGKLGLNLSALDLRGNNNVYTLATLLDGRATTWNEMSQGGGAAGKALKKLLVLVRYSGIQADGGGTCREDYGALFETLMI